MIIALGTALNSISTDNNYHTDFFAVTYWQATETQYEKNHLDYRDTTEEYDKNNLLYNTLLSIEIVAIVFETSTSSASDLGTLALEDLIRAIKGLSLDGVMFNLKRSHKYVETKGKTACHVELEIAVYYKF